MMKQLKYYTVPTLKNQRIKKAETPLFNIVVIDLLAYLRISHDQRQALPWFHVS